MRAMPLTATLALLLAGNVMATAAEDFQEVSFESADGGTVFGNLYGDGSSAVLLAHGAIFDKESWHALASEYSAAGLKVLAIDFRNYGKSLPGRKGKALEEDVLAAVRYLRAEGARSVSVVGGSMGGGAAARAAVQAEPGEIQRLVLLSGVPIKAPEQLHAGRILFVASRDERMAAAVERQHARAPEPKTLVLLEGEAHAQHIFKTDRAQELAALILKFLTAD